MNEYCTSQQDEIYYEKFKRIVQERDNLYERTLREVFRRGGKHTKKLINEVWSEKIEEDFPHPKGE